MSAGTLSLINNSSAVTGSGTAFTTELAVGDFIVVTVGGIPYTLPVKTVNSNTSLTLVSNFTGPTQSGAAWYAVPRVAMNMVTAALVTQSAEALRGLNYDKQNWQSIFSSTGNVTVKLPDGSTFTGPAWNGITTTLGGKLDKANNLGDLADKSVARTNLGLGSAATKDTGTSSGTVLTVGSLGFGWRLGSVATTTETNMSYASSGPHQPSSDGWYTHLFMAASAYYRANLALKCTEGSPRAFIRSMAGETSAWAELYSTVNTTKSSDGTLKAASPVARIVRSQEESQRSDIAEDGFNWCGCGTANNEAEGISISRLDVGVYVLTGSAGLASEGWQLLPPMDPGGMGELGVVEVEQTESGGLTTRLFKRKYMLNDDGEIVKTKGEPIDVPANSWIDVRLDMPENSIWNARQSAGNKIIDKSNHENHQDEEL